MSRKNEIRASLKGLGSNVKNMKGNPRGPVSKNLKVEPHASLYPGGRKVPGVDQPFVTQSQPIAKKPKAEAVEFHPIAVVPKGTPIHINVGGPGVGGNKPVATPPPRYLNNRSDVSAQAHRDVRRKRMREGKQIFGSPQEDTFSPGFTSKLRKHGYVYDPATDSWKKFVPRGTSANPHGSTAA